MIGILSVQGGFAKHQQMVQSLGFDTLLVKTLPNLELVDKLIMPGGESTTMRLLLKKHGLWDGLKDFCQHKPVFGTCAGAILLAHSIDDGAEESLDAIDIDISRNSYGRQVDSFTTQIEVNLGASVAQVQHVPAMFIRAPQITRVDPKVMVLGKHDELPVLVRCRNILLGTFHPELTHDSSICQYFLEHVL